MLNPQDILYFNCVAKKDVIAVTKNAALTINERFEDIYSKVEGYNFFKIRRDIIVNLFHVKAFTADHKAVMSNNMFLPVSSRQKNEFVLALSKSVIAAFNGRQ
jgi:DNA-binding LytR/AlgR family response regulator